jgi:hypothetical protein
MPIDPPAPENSSRLPHQRLVERSIPGIQNASPQQHIHADRVGACPVAREPIVPSALNVSVPAVSTRGSRDDARDESASNMSDQGFLNGEESSLERLA